MVIAPILVSTEVQDIETLDTFEMYTDKVLSPILCSRRSLRSSLDQILSKYSGTNIELSEWEKGAYHPTPTIIEAAKALYAGQRVEEISRTDAGAKNLSITTAEINRIIEVAKERKQKVICFVTGVPGAGKTLLGLNIATHRRDLDLSTHAVFLSGNGPLVAVLREALARDEYERKKKQGMRVRKGKVKESVKSFIQNIHHFRDDALINSTPPDEHVVIFDEAQRAWNLRQTANFMHRKKKRPGFKVSEPEFLISCMDRHSEWAVIICLVGGGQEINTGEACLLYTSPSPRDS